VNTHEYCIRHPPTSQLHDYRRHVRKLRKPKIPCHMTSLEEYLSKVAASLWSRTPWDEIKDHGPTHFIMEGRPQGQGAVFSQLHLITSIYCRSGHVFWESYHGSITHSQSYTGGQAMVKQWSNTGALYTRYTDQWQKDWWVLRSISRL